MISQLGPNANLLIANLNDRVVGLKETLDRVNDLLNAQNRGNISGSLANLNGMLAENRTNIRSTLNNVNVSSAKLGPLIDDFRKTSAQASDTLAHIDATIGEDRPDLHKAIGDLRQSLDSAVVLTGQLNRTLDTNTENLDEILDNLRHITDNMNEFTETIKTRPYTLIRASGLPAREPGQAPPK
jgi:phospholipid/cholesterol/gamma-HCH transport system substrate-binding protein